MKSPNKQHLIAQELSTLDYSTQLPSYEITCYEIDNDLRIAISSNIGLFPQHYITSVVKLSQEYGYHFYIRDSCAATRDIKPFIIIY